MRTRPRRTTAAADKAVKRQERRDERAARRARRRCRGDSDDGREDLDEHARRRLERQRDDEEDRDDAALARRLQREYDAEDRRRRRPDRKRRRSEVSRRESFGVRLKINGEVGETMVASPPKRPMPLPTPPKEGLTPGLDLAPWRADGWDVLCLACGDGGEVACCDGCPMVIHPKCAGLERMPGENEDFFCRTCEKDRCGCCLEGPIRKAEHVVCGEERASMRALGCGRTFHLSCVELDKVPEGDWLCASCQEEDEERAMDCPVPRPDEDLLLDAEAYQELQAQRLQKGDIKGAARCYLEARNAQLRAHSVTAEKGAPPRVRLVSYSTKRRGKANAPWSKRIFDATCLDHPSFKASARDRASMMTGILPSKRYVGGWSHADVATARSNAPTSEVEPVQLRTRDVARKVPRSWVDDLNERKAQRKKARTDAFLQCNRETGGRDLDGRDEAVRCLIRRDGKLTALINESRREIQAYRGRVVTLAFGDLLGQLRSVACVEEIASVLRSEFGEAVSVDAIHLDLKTTFSRY